MRLIVLVPQALLLCWAGWLYVQRGWRAGYSLDPSANVMIDHAGRPLAVREMRSRFGWPVWALVEIAAARHWRFSVRPRPRIVIGGEIRIGHAAFDDALLIGPGSQRLAEYLRVQESLRSHFALLLAQLARQEARLSRVVADDDGLSVEVNVRWTLDRPRLYRDVLAWLIEFERLLAHPDLGRGFATGAPRRRRGMTKRLRDPDPAQPQ
jgi:hypothetical protein